MEDIGPEINKFLKINEQTTEPDKPVEVQRYPPEMTERLLHALGEKKTSKLNKILSRMDDLTFDMDKPVEKPKTILGYGDCEIGSLGDFSLLIGKEKSKKSFLMTMMIAIALKDDGKIGDLNSDMPEGRRKVLFFDTEQSDYDVSLMVNRMKKLAKKDRLIDLKVFNLRREDDSIARQDFVEAVIYTNPDAALVVIDGAVDLVPSGMDDEIAKKFASRLMKWTVDMNCHIITVLHQNKNDNNSQGHLGSHLNKKAMTVLEVKEDEIDYRISSVTPLRTRRSRFEPFDIGIDMHGIPYLVDMVQKEKEQEEKDPEERRFDPILDMTDIEKINLVENAFFEKKVLKTKELKPRIKALIKESFKIRATDKMFKDLLNEFKSRNLIYKDKKSDPWRPRTEIIEKAIKAENMKEAELRSIRKDDDSYLSLPPTRELPF